MTATRATKPTAAPLPERALLDPTTTATPGKTSGSRAAPVGDEAPALPRTRTRTSTTRGPSLTGCDHTLGGLPCLNPRPHPGRGRGCVHHGESGVSDRHDYGDDE